jgi:hypothetical protein
MSFNGAQAAFYATRILERWEMTPDHPWCMGRTPPLEEERREVFESVLQAMATKEPDPDRTAACRHLLRHLALGSPRGPVSGGGTARG